MEVLEIDCNNCQWFNTFFITELKLNKSFTCDLCEIIYNS
jgi:hypothetical protein